MGLHSFLSFLFSFSDWAGMEAIFRPGFEFAFQPGGHVTAFAAGMTCWLRILISQNCSLSSLVRQNHWLGALQVLLSCSVSWKLWAGSREVGLGLHSPIKLGISFPTWASNSSKAGVKASEALLGILHHSLENTS